MIKPQLVVDIKSNNADWKVNCYPQQHSLEIPDRLLQGSFPFQIIDYFTKSFEQMFNLKFIIDGITLSEQKIEQLESEYIDFIFQD
jgi:hypothetical protein